MEKFLKDIKKVAEKENQIENIILVGSYAKETYKVINDGFKVIIDKKGYFKNITII